MNATAPKTATAGASLKDPDNRYDEDLAREVEGLRKDIAALTERFSRIGDAGVKTAKDYTRHKGAEAKERGEAVYAELSARASDLERQAADSVRRNPLQALGIAAGIGFLAAMLTRR